MNIESIDINRFHYSSFRTAFRDEAPLKQNLPFFCIAQSKVGRYAVTLNNEKEKFTQEGGFYIAPSFASQRLRHLVNAKTRDFLGRYLFLDVIINKRFRIGDLYTPPTVTDSESSRIIDRLFDKYEESESYCSKMSVIYSIIDTVIGASRELDVASNMDIYISLEYMHEHYRENITVADMAGLIKTSPSNFHNLFKSATGKSPIKYLNDIRLSLACDMLLQQDKSIAEISEAVGIPDQFYFSRLFKQRYDVSPMQYKKRIFWQ